MRSKLYAALIACFLSWGGMGYCYRILNETKDLSAWSFVFAAFAGLSGAYVGRQIRALTPPKSS